MVMSWKRHLQVRDMDESMKLECTCVSCGHTHYLTKAMICCSPEREFLYLDEVEAAEVCHGRGCRGRISLLLIEKHETSPFTGGLA